MDERRRRDELMQKEVKDKERIAEMNKKKEEEREERKRKNDEKMRKMNEMKQKQKEDAEAKQREIDLKNKEAERKRQEDFKARFKVLQQAQHQLTALPSTSILGSAQKKTNTYTIVKPGMVSSASENYMPLKQIGNTNQSSSSNQLHQTAVVKLNHQEIQNGFKKSLLFNQQIKQTQQMFASNKINQHQASSSNYHQKDNLVMSDDESDDEENEDDAYNNKQNNMETTYLCEKSPHENQSGKKVLQQQQQNSTFTNYAVIV
jgi:hypothetical protein